VSSATSYLQGAFLVGSLVIHSSVCLVVPQAKASSWQRRLDRALLDIDATPEARFRSFQRAVQDPNLRTDVTAAIDAVRTKGFGKGHPELINILWPQGTTARSDLEGLTALRTQLPEVIKELPELVKTSRDQRREMPSPSPPKSLDFAALPKPDEVREEFKNAFRSTPKGLETPKYSVVRTIEGEMKLGVPEKIEIRKYTAFTVAKTPSMGGTGFNTLASYLFGGNEEKQTMAMTMPVITTVGAKPADGVSAGTMQFVIPVAASREPPTPRPDDDVTVDRVPERLVAVKAFPGLVTDEEVARQKAALLSALDGEVDVVNGEEVSVLQYNSPLTIPWRRRNEIAVVVEQSGGDDDVDERSAFEIWRNRTVATSYYDAGVRM